MSKKYFLVLLSAGLSVSEVSSSAVARRSTSESPIELSEDEETCGVKTRTNPFVELGEQIASVAGFATQLAQAHSSLQDQFSNQSKIVSMLVEELVAVKRIQHGEGEFTDSRLCALEAQVRALDRAGALSWLKKMPALEAAVESSGKRLEQIDSAIAELSRQQEALGTELARLTKRRHKKK